MRPERTRTPLAALLLAGLLAGCKMAPVHSPPALDLPAQYKAQGLWREAAPASPDAVPEAWWTLFGDPELDHLQAQAQAGNQSLAAMHAPSEASPTQLRELGLRVAVPAKTG